MGIERFLKRLFGPAKAKKKEPDEKTMETPSITIEERKEKATKYVTEASKKTEIAIETEENPLEVNTIDPGCDLNKLEEAEE
jgi:hypothetical protein